MRTFLPYLPLFLCAGTMVVCVRMMSGKHEAPKTSAKSETTTSSETEPEPSAQTDR
jgi:hypothetical protein